MTDSRPETPRAIAPLAPYLALAGIWLLTITIVPPRGNFPLNDDWMYAKVVQHLVETGEYQPTPYADPTFILQAYWGAAFVKLFGFGFETLRLSTLVLALVAVWAAHWAARESGLNKPWAFFVALVLLANPLFLNLSYTFMTDVPLIALTCLSGASYLRAFRTNAGRWLWIGGALAAAGFLVRQFSILLVIAAIAYWSLRHATGRSRPKITEALALIMPFVVLPLNSLLPTGGLDAAAGWDWEQLGDGIVAQGLTIARFCAITAIYLSLFAAPVFIAGRLPNSDRARWRIRMLIPAIALMAWLVFPVWPHRLPNLGNVLYDLGVGPLLLPGMLQDDAIAAPARLGARVWVFVTILTLVFGARTIIVLADRPLRHLKQAWQSRESLGEPDTFLVLWAAAMVLVLILPPVLARFDRYLLPALVPILIVLVRDCAGSRWLRPHPVAFVMVGAMYLFGVVCLQDYLAWNAARWRAVVALQQAHAAPLVQINGGYEFNGWFHSDHYAEESRRTGKKVFGPAGWWIRGDDFRVSLRPNDHFEVIGTEPYVSWLGWKKRSIYLLKRTEPDENFALSN